MAEGVKVSKAKHAKRAKASPKAAPMPAMDEEPGDGYMPSNLSDGEIFPLPEGELSYEGMF
ncbi:hypothetical protein HPT29_018530 [Microvirga terrae]|uniref:Uncharacterized protein n=1 Tax=Microvirga terrae TaxID=2740529 RepID=A0ABY5RQ92_9HYPH|nr:hypothetical protein [Microvirga terrae]UVF18469.1 hypothetical protein HPT29_018530 [Microvirga terrae]